MTRFPMHRNRPSNIPNAKGKGDIPAHQMKYFESIGQLTKIPTVF